MFSNNIIPVTNNMRVFHEEQFGQLFQVIDFDDIDIPLNDMSNSNYGQQVSVFERILRN